jgi:hypothetical protein
MPAGFPKPHELLEEKNNSSTTLERFFFDSTFLSIHLKWCIGKIMRDRELRFDNNFTAYND